LYLRQTEKEEGSVRL